MDLLSGTICVTLRKLHSDNQTNIMMQCKISAHKTFDRKVTWMVAHAVGIIDETTYNDLDITTTYT